MVTQAEAIEAVATGSREDEIQNPSGMGVVDPNNIGAETILISLMEPYYYRLNRRNPPAVLLIRKSDGRVIRNENFHIMHYSHRRKVMRNVNTDLMLDKKLLYHYDDGFIYERGNDDPYIIE